MTSKSILCSACTAIPFDRIFALPSAEVGRQGLPVTDTRFTSTSDCILCTHIFERLDSKDQSKDEPLISSGTSYHLRAILSLSPLRLRFTKQRIAASPSIVVAIVRGPSNVSVKRRRINEAINRGFIAPVTQASAALGPSDSPFTYTGRVVEPRLTDFQQIASWIRECQDSDGNLHSRCVRRDEASNFPLRVINCWTRSVVPYRSDMRFLALSYVWGQSTTTTVSDTDLFPSSVIPTYAPQTIEDAMSFVRSIGESYLWVDRYCIWDTEDKHLQIQNMNLIYQRALCTIVAADGPNADSGLCGISYSRQPQYRMSSKVGLLVSTHHHISYQLLSSVYISRGWTYQEALLSRSCLFFTRDQVYFACRTHSRSESVHQLPLPHNDRAREALAPRLMSHAEQENFALVNHLQPFFYEHIKAYTSRSLTFDSDALNAFKGIIASGREYTYWGIPFTTAYPRDRLQIEQSECAFAQSLAWKGNRFSNLVMDQPS